MKAQEHQLEPKVETLDPSSVMEHIPLAVTAADDEQVVIPLDKLLEEINTLKESMQFGGDGQMDEVLDEELYEDLDEAFLEEDLFLEEEDEDLEEDMDAALYEDELEEELMEEKSFMKKFFLGD